MTAVLGVSLTGLPVDPHPHPHPLDRPQPRKQSRAATVGFVCRVKSRAMYDQSAVETPAMSEKSHPVSNPEADIFNQFDLVVKSPAHAHASEMNAAGGTGHISRQAL